MKTNLKQITGNWDDGYALDKHIVSSTFIGHNEYGRPTFDTERTEAGEAVYQLKYRKDQKQIDPLAGAVVDLILPKFARIGLVIPVPASTSRPIQPVYEVARSVAKKIGVTSFENIVLGADIGKQFWRYLSHHFESNLVRLATGLLLKRHSHFLMNR